MFHRTPLISQRHSSHDKENVTIFTPNKSARLQTPAKVPETIPLTPSRQPLATVNGDGSGLRGQKIGRQSLKPSLPRIEALRSEDAGLHVAPRGSKTPGKLKKQKPRSHAATPAPAKMPASKEPEKLLDSITTQLFDKLVKEELGGANQKSTFHTPRPDRGELRDGIVALKSSIKEETDAGNDDVSPEEITAFIDGVINSAVQQVQIEARINALEGKLQKHDAVKVTVSQGASIDEPGDDDVAAYVDSVLDIQLQIVQKEFQERLDACLATPASANFETLSSPSGCSNSSYEASSFDASEDGIFGEDARQKFEASSSPVVDAIAAKVTTRYPDGSVLSPINLLDAFDSLSFDGASGLSSPGYMLLPRRRESTHQQELSRTTLNMRHESLESEGSYENEFLKFVQKQNRQSAPPVRLERPCMLDAAVGTPRQVANFDTSVSPMQEVTTQECGTGMEVASLQDAMVGTPTRMTSTGIAMTPVRLSDFQTNTSPMKLSHASTETRVEVTDCGSDACKQDVCDAMVGTPVRHSVAGVGTSPVSVQETASCMTPIRMSSMATGTSPARMTDIGTEMPVVNLVDTGIGSSTVSIRDTASYMTPIKMNSTGMSTSPAKLTDIGTEMPLVEMMEAGIGTSPPPTVTESATGMSPIATVDRECGGTPIQMQDTMCGSTPQQHSDGATAMTPVFISSTQTLTSPPVVPSLRFSSSPSTIESSKLVSHVKTATISNQLLRTELQMLRSQKEEVEEKLLAAKRQIQEKEDMMSVNEEKIGHLQRTARASAEKELEDMMGQLGEQMMQIGQLEAATREKNHTISELKSEKEKLKKDYNQQISELQEDLCRSYKQHQQQLTELEAEYKRDDYARHYARSQGRVRELETQLDAFMQLQETIEKATQVQAGFAVAEKTFSEVVTLFKLASTQHEQVMSQKRELEEEQSRLESDKESWRQKLEEGEKRLEENEEKMNECYKRELDGMEKQFILENDLSQAEAAMTTLQEQLETKGRELLQKDAELQELSEKCTELEQRGVAHFLELQSQEAAMLTQIEEHASVKAQFEMTRDKLEKSIENLQKQCQSLTSEKLAMEVESKSNKSKLFSLEAELSDTRKKGEEQTARISELERELETCKDAKRDLKAVESKVKKLENQFLENKQFLEEERCALEESAKEVETELRITSMELARSKASLCEGDMVRKQMQETVNILREQVESLQCELDHTKTQAHWMVLNQGSEISNSSAALEQLSEQVSSMLAKMGVTTVDKVSEASSRGFITERRGKGSHKRSKHQPSTPASSSSGSLVVSVLRAMHQVETPGNASTSTADISEVEHQSLEGPVGIGQSGSAFQAVKPLSSGKTEDEDSGGEDGGTSEGGVKTLPDQVQSLRGLLGRVLDAFLEKDLTVSKEIEDLQQEIVETQRQAKRSSQRSESQVNMLHEQLEEALSQRQQMQQELAGAQGRSCDLRQALDYAQERMESMASNLARFSDQKSTIEEMEHQIAHLTSSLQLAAREKDSVMSQFEALVAAHPGHSISSQDAEGNASAVKENLLLKKELDKVRMKYLQRQEDYELFHNKAAKQMKVLEGNWKKAEAEIHRLDQLYDHCRQVMEKVPSSYCQKDPNLKLLYEMFGCK